MSALQHILALSGGVGGAKLVAGLAEMLGANLTVVVNTADDFDHLGLRICPDLDSVLYRVAGLNDTARGWGRRDESWHFLETLGQIGGPDWFRLGDRDMAVHVWRSAQLGQGVTLRAVTASLATAMSVSARIIPMTDDPVSTMLTTDEGVLPFQDYFVARQCAPRVERISFDGAQSATPAPELLSKDFDGIVLCPSNPFVSIDPILALPGVRAALAGRNCPAIAVSPFIRGDVLKGPAGKMCRELGLTAGITTLLSHYDGLIDALIVDRDDLEGHSGLDDPEVVLVGDEIVMTDTDCAASLARTLLGHLQNLKGRF